ncbi:DEAD/DEAH box helicase family protein [Leptothoe sp. ISB3NOV94-8A]
MTDSIRYRPFQETGIPLIIKKYKKGSRIATANPFPGSGKTALSFGVAVELYRLGMIDAVVHANPRTALCGQFSEDWSGYHDDDGVWHSGFNELFDSPKFKAFTVGSNPRDFKGYEPRYAYQAFCTGEEDGYSICFSSLISSPEFHRDFAKQKRTLLVLDEAQYLGIDPKTGEPTNKFAGTMDQLAEFYPYILVMGGTSRGNGERVWGVQYTAPDPNNEIFPVYDVTASYQEGVAQGYLRDVMFKMPDAEGIWHKVGKPSELMQVSKMKRKLGRFLKEAEFYQHLIDISVNELNDAKAIWQHFGMLVAAYDQGQAKKIEAYFKTTYPHLKTVVAISSDGPKSIEALQKFKRDESIDVLITVRQAFIGFSCNRLNVLCCLTNYREWGFLDQLFGRVARVRKELPFDVQPARVIMPCDPEAVAYAEAKKSEAMAGLRIKKKQASKPKNSTGKKKESGSMADLEVLPSVVKGTDESKDLGHQELAYLEQKHGLEGIATTSIAKILRDAGVNIAENMKRDGFIPPSMHPDKTLQQLRDQLLYEVTGTEKSRNPNAISRLLRYQVDTTLSRNNSYEAAWYILKQETGIDIQPKYADREQLTNMLRYVGKIPALGEEYLRAKISQWRFAKTAAKGG